MVALSSLLKLVLQLAGNFAICTTTLLRTGDVLTDQLLRRAARENRSESHARHLLNNLASIIKARLLLEEPINTSWEAPVISCPSASTKDLTALERHHHSYFENMLNHGCHHQIGLWKNGCGIYCPVRAAVVGLSAGLRPGQVVLDLGSGCGRQAHWYYSWFRVHTVGIEYHWAATEYAQKNARDRIPAKFCTHDLADGLDWTPERFADLSLALSVLHYTHVDQNLEYSTAAAEHVVYTGTRTPCDLLASTERTQCSIARGMYRATKVGGLAWIADNGNYKGKFDPKKVWGVDYWNCCFKSELGRKQIEIREIDELDLFFYQRPKDRTYSLLLKRVM